MPIQTLQEHLRSGGLVGLDGGLGSELGARGVALGEQSWSGEALLHPVGRQAIRAIHADFIEAGAPDLPFITITNSFRTPRLGEHANDATQAAVQLAREAAERTEDRDVIVAGSAGPIADCYRPWETPGDQTVADHHLRHAQNLAQAGADFLLGETIGSIREIEPILEAASEFDLPVAISLLPHEDGDHLKDGASFKDALEIIGDYTDVLYTGINCVNHRLATKAIGNLIRAQRDNRWTAKLPLTVYAQGYNPDSPDQVPGLGSAEAYRKDYLVSTEEWLDLGVQIPGGCCSVRPEDIRDITRLIVRHEQEAGLELPR